METVEITQHDLDKSNAFAKTMTLETVPKILMTAFDGVVPAPTVLVNTAEGQQPKLTGVPDELVTNEAPSESTSPTRGLILTEDNIIDIKRYVWNGLKLPTSVEDVRAKLGYSPSFDENAHPEIAPAAFAALNTQINTHCKKWSDLEASIKSQGTSLKIFSQHFVNTGGDVLEVIQAMPVLERIKKSIGDIHFDAEDKTLQGGLVELLSSLRKDAEKHQADAHSLAERLEAYRRELENEIVPSTNKMNDTLVRIQQSGETAKLLEEKAKLDAEIKNLNKQYDKLVGYAFTGAAGLVLGPVGIISWAVTGGVFGDKAERVRKERNKRQKERDEIIGKLDTEDKLLKFAANTHSSVSKQCAVLDKALVGVKNLEVMWNAVVQYVDDATAKVKDMDEGKSLLLFQNSMKAAVTSWSEVQNITGELVALFEAATKRAKEMGLEDKTDANKKEGEM